MPKTDFKTIDEYLATQPEEVRAFLQEVRETIQKAVPEAEEVISYQIPAFQYHGFVLYFSAYKKHVAISSVPETFAPFEKELAEHKTTKSSLQIPYDKPIPKALITKLAKWRAAKNVEEEKEKAAKKKK